MWNVKKREGIQVYYVVADYTSQTCSKCGSLSEGQRETQESFKCKSSGFTANVDYNASRVIAKSNPKVGKDIKIEGEVFL